MVSIYFMRALSPLTETFAEEFLKLNLVSKDIYTASAGLSGITNGVRRKKTDLHEDLKHKSNADDLTPEITLFAEEKKDMLRDILNLLDDSCRSILTLWKQSYSMQEIAEKLNLSSAQLAKKYKYRCIKKLMKVLENKPQLLKALKDE